MFPFSCQFLRGGQKDRLKKNLWKKTCDSLAFVSPAHEITVWSGQLNSPFFIRCFKCCGSCWNFFQCSHFLSADPNLWVYLQGATWKSPFSATLLDRGAPLFLAAAQLPFIMMFESFCSQKLITCTHVATLQYNQTVWGEKKGTWI